MVAGSSVSPVLAVPHALHLPKWALRGPIIGALCLLGCSATVGSARWQFADGFCVSGRAMAISAELGHCGAVTNPQPPGALEAEVLP